MGCNASTPSRGRTVTIDADDAETWNANYHEISEEMSTTLQKLRSTSSMGLGEESTNSTISKEGLNVRSVNGYIFGKNLGKGAFGEVYTAKKGGQKFAIKVLRKSALKKMRMGRMGSALDTVKTEIATMKKIVHPNCVHMFDVILDNRHDEIFLVLEFVEGGNSQKTGADGKPLPLEEKTIWSYMRHLVMGLEYLHMNNIVHRDIKPENLLVTKNGVLKVADFGTSCFCEGDDNAQKTAGTPTFFSPELCTAAGKGTYDARVVDLWAVGVTVHLWLSGAPPFTAETTMLLMNQIRDAPDKVPAPANASKGLQNVMEGLLVKRPDKRLTLNQLRMHPWLTRRSTQPLPAQPVIPVEVSAEDVAMAFTSRAAMQYQSAAGPSALGRLVGKPSDWKREDLNTIRKRTNGAEARFFKAIAGSGALSPHIPVIYSITRVAKDANTIVEEVGGAGEDDGLEMSMGQIGAAGGEGSGQEVPFEYAGGPAARDTEGRGTQIDAMGDGEVDGEDSMRAVTPPDGAVPVTKLRSMMQAGPEQVSVQGEDGHEVYHIRMQDLASNMTRPCAMRFIMGDRTVTSENFRDKTLHKSLLDEVKAIDPSAVTAADEAAGGLTRQRYLRFYDEASSTRALGFRVDGAQLTLPDGRRDNISPPEGKTLDTLREDDDLVQMFLSFVQSDLSLAKQVVLKVSSILAALERSAFFPSHAFLRSAILLTYDDAARETRVEMKLINFQSSYAMPQAQTLQHNTPWSGDVNDREDGYMLGVQSLLRITQLVVAKLESS